VARKKIVEIEMIEWILVVWLYSSAGIAPAIEIGVYTELGDCEAARDTVHIDVELRDVGFITLCRERDK
jgi:hypothetical protein